MPAAFPDLPRVLALPRDAEAERAQLQATRAARLALLRAAPTAFRGEGAAPAPASVLHFHRPAMTAAAVAPSVEPVCDLDRIPGLGPNLIWALGRAGVTRRADLAECAPADLAARLGAVGRLAPVAAWIAQARAATVADS